MYSRIVKSFVWHHFLKFILWWNNLYGYYDGITKTVEAVSLLLWNVSSKYGYEKHSPRSNFCYWWLKVWKNTSDIYFNRQVWKNLSETHFNQCYISCSEVSDSCSIRLIIDELAVVNLLLFYFKPKDCHGSHFYCTPWTEPHAPLRWSETAMSSTRETAAIFQITFLTVLIFFSEIWKFRPETTWLRYYSSH